MKTIVSLALLTASLSIFCTPPTRPQDDILQQIRFARYQRRMNERYTWDPAQVLPYEKEEFHIPTAQNLARRILREKTISQTLIKQDIVQYKKDYNDPVLLDELLCSASTEGDACLMLLLLSNGANLHVREEYIKETGWQRFEKEPAFADDVPIWSAVRNGNPAAVQVLLEWSNRHDQQQFSKTLIKKLIKFVENRIHYYENDDYERIITFLLQYYLSLRSNKIDCEEIAVATSQSAMQQFAKQETDKPCHNALCQSEQQVLANFVSTNAFNDEGKPLKMVTKKERQLLYQTAIEQKMEISQQSAELLTSRMLNIYKSNAAWRLEFIVQKYPDVLIDGRYKLSMLIEILEKLIPQRR